MTPVNQTGPGTGASSNRPGRRTTIMPGSGPPAEQPRLRLPIAVKADLASRIDWPFTILAAMSFLVHFGLVGALYSDWTDPVVDEDITVGLLPMLRRTAAEPPPAEIDETRAEPTTYATGARSSSTAKRSERRDSSSGTSKPDPAGVRALLDSVERTRIEILVDLGSGRALSVASRAEGDGPPVDLNALATRSDGVQDADLGLLRLPYGSEPLRTRGTLQDLRPPSEPPAASTAGPVRVVVPPIEVQYQPPIISVPISNAEAIIRSQIHPGARRCYQKGLESDRNQSGRLVLRIHVRPSGEVDAADATTHYGLSSAVVGCIEHVAKQARFDPPGPVGSTLNVPFNFVRQGS